MKLLKQTWPGFLFLAGIIISFFFVALLAGKSGINYPRGSSGDFGALDITTTGSIYTESHWSTILEDMNLRVSNNKLNNYFLSASLGTDYKDENKETVTLSSGNNLIHSFIFAKGYIFGGTRTTPARFIRFNDLDDLTDYTVTTFASDGKHVNAESACYDPTRDKIYILFNHASRVCVTEFDPDDLTNSDVIDDDTDPAGTSGSIISDGTYLYIITRTSPAKVLKYDFATFSQDSANAITGKNLGHSIQYDGTNLYATGSSSPAWVAKIDPSDLTFSTADFASGDNTAPDTFAIVGDYLYVGLEATNGIINRVKKSDLSLERIYAGWTSACYGVYFDGRYVWAVYGTSPGTIVRIDPGTLEVASQALATGENTANSVISDGQRLFLTCWLSPAKVIRKSMFEFTGDSYAWADASGNWRLSLDASGNFGVGTATPTAALQMGNDKLFAADTNAGLTASVTQSQGQGALTAQVNEISTVANDDDTVTLPAALAGLMIEIINNGANTLQIFPASGDNLGTGVDTADRLELNESVEYVAYDSTNWRTESTTEIVHAEIHDEDNTDVYVINDAGADFHAYHTNGLVGGDLADWTFDAGGGGTSFPVASIADSPGSSGTQAQITTTGSHGLAAGDIVSLTNTSAGTNAGFHVVVAPVAATTFEIVSSNSTDATGTMDQAATLDIATGSAGSYFISWSASATSATNNETFDFEIRKNAATAVGTKTRRKFGTAADFGSFSGLGIVDIANGDKISFALSNEDSAGNITIRNLTLALIRL